MDFANNVLFKSYGKKTTFLLCWHGRPYDNKGSSLTYWMGQPLLVACTEGPLHKEKYTYFALCFYFLGKLTRPRLVHCAHAAILRQTSPDHTHCRLFTWCKCTVPATLRTSTALALYTTVIVDVIAVSYTHAEAYALLCFHSSRNSLLLHLNFRLLYIN